MSHAQPWAQASRPTTKSRATPETPAAATTKVRAVFFDFMGTCLDWHSAVACALPPGIPEAARSRLALDWREEFFRELHARAGQGKAPEDIDATHRRTLLRLLREPQRQNDGLRHHFLAVATENAGDTTATGTQPWHPDGEGAGWPAVERAVASWHRMRAWDDVLPALSALRDELGLELFVLANGTTRLQLDLARSAGLGASFDMLLSSELLGVYKPAAAAYEKALALVRVRPEQAVMVAAHAYDLRAARAVGMRTVYVHRWTDDASEDMQLVRRENEHFLDEGGMDGLVGAIRAM
ncbi:HAD-like protein [Xylaria palmicola]|nr:HAD-like protein [Xylaria palmicola]